MVQTFAMFSEKALYLSAIQNDGEVFRALQATSRQPLLACMEKVLLLLAFHDNAELMAALPWDEFYHAPVVEAQKHAEHLSNWAAYGAIERFYFRNALRRTLRRSSN